MAAITCDTVLSFHLHDGAYNAEHFIAFITTFLKPYFEDHPKSVLIMNNCRFHHSQEVLRVLNEFRISFKFLPPYSPQLNPIEEYFGEIKANYKKIKPLAKTREEIKERVLHLLSNRTRNFLASFGRARNFVDQAISRHHFI